MTVAIEREDTPAAVNFLQQRFGRFECLRSAKRKAAAPFDAAAR
jgi:hypothetical protein